MKKITLLFLMAISYSGFAQFYLPYCGPMTFTFAVEPITLVNFAGINNATSALVGPDNGTTIIAHEDYVALTGNVTAGSTLPITFKGNTAGNYITFFRVYVDWNQNSDFTDAGESYDVGTITNSTGDDAIQLIGSIAVPPTALLGSTRMRVVKRYNAYGTSCQTGTGYGQAEDYTLIVAAVPTDLPDYVGLQFPATGAISEGNSIIVYGQVFEAGLTNVDPNIVGQAPGISAWVGVNATNTNPNTWTNWTPATWNAGNASNNDEYQANIGSELVAGTYYYATRFSLNNGAFVYGGTDNASPNANGNFWNGTTHFSGVLTVTAAAPPSNDACAGAIALTAGGIFTSNPVTGTMLASTLTAGITPSCQATNIVDVWYTVQVPASGSITIETQTTATNSLIDTVVSVFTDCAGTTPLGCDDDGGLSGPNGLMSILSLTGQTPGSIIYIGVWKYGTDAPTLTTRNFTISAYDASLGNSSFDNANFSFYPNPVKNVLNISYNQEISNVELFNLLGQKVSSVKVDANAAEIDMSNLSKGAYMVKVTSNNQVKTIKVIKE